jgi:Macrocin-O-methyltransferase (TylF)
VKIDGEYTNLRDAERQRQRELGDIASTLIPRFGVDWPRHSLVALGVRSLARILYYSDLYKKILDVPGVICEFGVQWGSTLSQLIALRSIYEPFNTSRKVIGFDTFAGFPSVDVEDGVGPQTGDYGSETGHKETLERILSLHESFSPNSQVKKFELVEGDATITIGEWLDGNKHAIIAMAIFDMDLYKPTKEVLSKILPRLTKGSILVFDELNYPEFPGETLAVNEVLGLNKLTLKRSPYQPYCAWASFEG